MALAKGRGSTDRVPLAKGRGSTDGVSPKTSSTHARHAREHATPNAGCTVQSREPEKRLASSTDVNARPVTVDSCPVRAPEEVTTYYNSVVIISSHLGASDCPRTEDTGYVPK